MRILVCGGRTYGHWRGIKKGTPTLNALYRERLSQYLHTTKMLDKIIAHYCLWIELDGSFLPLDLTIISGGAPGADTTAENWAVNNHCDIERFPADWERYGKRAGFIRNQEMLDKGKPDLVVAFPGGVGTKMMVRIATEAGVPVIKIKRGQNEFQPVPVPPVRSKANKNTTRIGEKTVKGVP